MVPPSLNPSQLHPGAPAKSEYHTMTETIVQFVEKHRVIGLYAIRRMTPPVPSVQLTSQHAGPILTGYIASATIAVAAHLAHRSRRLMIRTASQIANATNAMPKTARNVSPMPSIVSEVAWRW